MNSNDRSFFLTPFKSSRLYCTRNIHCKISVIDKNHIYINHRLSHQLRIFSFLWILFFFFFFFFFSSMNSTRLWHQSFRRKKETEDIQCSLMVRLMLGTCSSQISRQPSNFRERDIQEDRLVSLITWTWSPCVMNSIDQRGSQVLYADIEFPRVFSVFCDYLDEGSMYNIRWCNRNMLLCLK